MQTMLDKLATRPIIPVIVIDDADDAEPLAEALLSGGLDIIEVTMRTAAAEESIRRICKKYPEMLVGAGTVVTRDNAERAIDAGSSFGLAPGLNPDIVTYFQSVDTLFIPGVMTPSEIEKGLSLGCKQFKFYPAEQAGGAAMLKAISGPYLSQGLKFCPTGGVSKENMNNYLSLPVVSNIGGSWLATQQQIADKNWSAITEQVKSAIALLD